MRWRTGVLISATCFVLAGCGGGYSSKDAAALLVAQSRADNAICKHRDEDPSSVFRCRAQRTDEPWAATKVSIDGSGRIKFESCYAVRFVEHWPPGTRPPCIGTGIGPPFR